MDPSRFDALARALGAGRSRRGLLGAALAAALAPLAAAGQDRGGPSAEGPCGGGVLDKCARDADCCNKRCDRAKGRCRCARSGEPCTRDRNCCDRAAGGPLTCQGTPGARTCKPASCPGGCGECETCRRGSCEPANDGACCAGAERDGVCASGTCRDCGAGTPFCASGTCAECRGGEDCGEGQACCGGACIDLGTDANCGGCGDTCEPTQLCDRGECVTGIGTCAAGANACVAFVTCNGNPGCFCLPTRAGATRCTRYYTEAPHGFLRPCAADADCADLGAGAFCPPRFNSCGGVCSLPC